MTKVQTKMKQTWIPWIWEISEDWDVKKLKYVFKYITWATPDSWKNNYYNNWNNNWITISDLNWKNTSESKNKITDLAVKEKNMKVVPKWSLLYSFKLSVWQLAFVSDDTYTNEAIFWILPLEWLNLNFWYYALWSYFISNANENIYWAKIFNQFIIDNWFLIIPSIKNQNIIANYLDQKTSQINTFIKNKKRLIELLEEQKISIINKAVTKWLDENVKMKDSWIPWIWEIPEDWEVRKLKHFISILTDFTANWSFWDLAKNVTYLDNGYSRVIRLTDLRVNFENQWVYIDENAHNYLKKSELFWWEILIANVWAYTWFVCIMPKVDFISTLWPNMFLLRFNNQVLDKFIYYFLLSDFWNKQLVVESDSSAQPKLNKYEVKNITIFLPQVTEQEKIIEYIEKQTSKINQTIQTIENELKLIEEYKDSLIYQAVTWKLNIQ